MEKLNLQQKKKKVREFYDFMKTNGCSEMHINNNLKAIMNFDSMVDPKKKFLEVQTRDQILTFFDSKMKTTGEDPDRKCITTGNHYLSHLKYFFRWLYNICEKKHSKVDTFNFTTASYPL